jgi:septal ring factor EnvC (AmiA/AmiB activator)
MHHARLWGLIALLAASPVRASGGPVAQAAVSASTRAALPQARQRLQQHRADVEKLQQAVARQESDRKQASERLQRQDEAINELHKQLQALHAEPTTGHH